MWWWWWYVFLEMLLHNLFFHIISTTYVLYRYNICSIPSQPCIRTLRRMRNSDPIIVQFLSNRLCSIYDNLGHFGGYNWLENQWPQKSHLKDATCTRLIKNSLQTFYYRKPMVISCVSVRMLSKYLLRKNGGSSRGAGKIEKSLAVWPCFMLNEQHAWRPCGNTVSKWIMTLSQLLN